MEKKSIIDLNAFKEKTERLAGANRKFLQALKKKDARRVDEIFHRVHDEVFEETDCLTCANCCKTTSPIFYQTDIERAARYLRVKPGDFVHRYLRLDEDNDFVLKSAPCPFLDQDNYCSIYEARPKACREYPHTNRRRMTQIMDLTYKNSLICPAVLEMVERIRNSDHGL
jgi:Fe-S-cluster containining protein